MSEILESGDLDHSAVEREVKLGHGEDVAGFARPDHPLNRLAEGVEVCVRGHPARPCERASLQQGPDPVDGLHLDFGDADDHGAAVRIELDEAFLLQLAEGLANRPAADAQLGRHGDLQEARPGGDLA